jgi:hypothetical protein
VFFLILQVLWVEGAQGKMILNHFYNTGMVSLFTAVVTQVACSKPCVSTAICHFMPFSPCSRPVKGFCGGMENTAATASFSAALQHIPDL